MKMALAIFGFLFGLIMAFSGVAIAGRYLFYIIEYINEE